MQVGACVPAGRFQTDDFDALADVADKYTNGEVRLTCEENVIFPNVKNEDVEALKKEKIFEKLRSRRATSCGALSAAPAASSAALRSSRRRTGAPLLLVRVRRNVQCYMCIAAAITALCALHQDVPWRALHYCACTRRATP